MKTSGCLQRGARLAGLCAVVLWSVGAAAAQREAEEPPEIAQPAAEEIPAAGAPALHRGELPLPFAVRDTPSDDGRSLTLTWEDEELLPTLRGLGLLEDVQVTIERAGGEERFREIERVELTDGQFRDSGLSPGEAYRYRLGIRLPSGARFLSAVSAPIEPGVDLFRQQRLNALILTLLMAAMVIGFIMAAKRGADLFIRRIAGLDAIDEAIGRATEMGRKILYVPGIISVNEIQTIASLGILGYVAKRSAQYGSYLEVPNIDPLTMAAAREIVKQSYLEAGAPESYHEDMVHYITADQFAYTAAVNGIMVRDKPAATFLIGWFAAESLLLAEVGQSIGAIQIAGTAQVTQLPFFVAACDYTMIGEELFAASAYLSRDPLILGSIKGQDVVKAAIVLAIVLGVVLVTSGATSFPDWFTAR
ncbi:MAG: hypothetical protein GF330_09675 [Candidatus Eisenbacteria bacterium]|nr:hypothetical protein [Candidatus Eisenbacteria bacterium]